MLLLLGLCFTVVAADSNCSNETPPLFNVGTTLFRPSDVSRKCWSVDDMAQLKARRLAQSLIPADMCVDVEEKAQAVADYIQLVARAAEGAPRGPARLVVVRAVADALGGWLRVRVLPRVRASFYAGRVSFETARRLHSLLEEAKSLLRTDGQFWKPAEHVEPEVEAGAKRHRRSGTGTEACAELLTHGNGSDMRIPVPFFDNPSKPSVMALPVRGRVLVNLDDPAADSLLRHFYEAACDCLAGTQQEQTFQEEFREWLEREVTPLLSCEHWYPALGGVAMLLVAAPDGEPVTPDHETAVRARKKLDTWRHADQAPGSAPPAQLPIEGGAGDCRVARFFRSLSAWEMAALLIASAVLVWLKVAFCFVIANCFRRRKKPPAGVLPAASPKDQPGSGSRTPTTSSSGRASILSALVSVLGGVSAAQAAASASAASQSRQRSSAGVWGSRMSSHVRAQRSASASSQLSQESQGSRRRSQTSEHEREERETTVRTSTQRRSQQDEEEAKQ